MNLPPTLEGTPFASIVARLERRAELPPLKSKPEAPLVLYYHGGIAPNRLPLSVIEMLPRLGGRACLRFAGYGPAGYIQRLLDLGSGSGSSPRTVEYLGQLPQRSDVQGLVESADIGGAVAHLAHDDVLLALTQDRQARAGR